jgi:hypothetical protein
MVEAIGVAHGEPTELIEIERDKERETLVG